MFSKILPISLAIACSVATGNMALVHASTSFVEMISSCTPVCTVIVAIVFDQPFRKQLMWPVLLVSGGLCLCASGAVKFSRMGFVFSLLATLLRSVKAVLQQILMVGEKAKFGPLELLAWISVPSVVVMLSWSLATEGLQPYRMLAEAPSHHLVLSIGLTCANACILNVMATFVVKDLGAVGAQLTGQLKGVLTVLGGVAILHETVYFQQAVGYGFVLLGVFWYTNMEASLKAQENQKADQVLQEGSPLLQNPFGVLGSRLQQAHI
jgi:drug/metabolite transporter (DMT)-like permease